VLTADLVRLRKKGDVHALEGLGAAMREELHALADRIVRVGAESVGRTRGEIELARMTEGVSPREKQLARALEVVFDDASAYEGGGGEATVETRMGLFEAAAKRRREADAGATFDRDAVIAAFALEQGLVAETVERNLYADRKREERLVAAGFVEGDALVRRWELARVQAMLLRATAITITFARVEPPALRRLLRALKFHQLLHVVELRGEHEAVVRIDGASSLFDATTKYGLRYATLVPHIIAAGASEIVAELKLRPKKTFRADDELLATLRDEAERLAGEVAQRPEVEDLFERFPELASRWSVVRGSRVVSLAGVAVCVPDLDFLRDDGLRVGFELMGYWSRKAVWARVEAVEHGLAEPVLFAVSERLRVSKEALPQESPSALYVFKGTLRPKAVLEHLEAVAAACDARQTPRIEAKTRKKSGKRSS
jgi:predicted nuclease of restriction endonuclease-like RecB superfamily